MWWQKVDYPHTDTVTSTSLGIDLSDNNAGPFDWPQITNSGVRFAYIKASEGNSTSYDSLDSQYIGAKSAGLAVGLYHFARPGVSPEANADAFAAQINRLGAVAGHLPPCLDLESGIGNLSGWALRFITRLRTKTGCTRVMLYSGASFFKDQIGESWMDPNISLWIAHYGVPIGRPMYLTPRVAMHQYASSGRINGINGNVDLSALLWPISNLMDGNSGDDLTQQEHDMLVALYQFISGSTIAGQWPGWPTWGGGTNENLTATDYLRRSNVETRQMWNELKAMRAELAQLRNQIHGTA